jgi:hypothetical protein
MQSGMVASKYDRYWAAHLAQVQEGLRLAVSTGIVEIHLNGLRSEGDRRSWNGIAEVRGRRVQRSSMAHATSLAKVVADSGICEDWPDRAIRLTVNSSGDVLTVSGIAVGSEGKPSRPITPGPAVNQPPAHRPARPSGASPKADTEEFYAVLGELAQRVGGPRLLRDCTARSGWPSHGVYFFFEDGEVRPDGSGRVVRVGTHAVTAISQSTLWGRLRQHRGHQDGSGNHRASIFRGHVGTALIHQQELPPELLDSWLAKRNPAGDLAVQEATLERMVSDYIGAMPFLWLAVPELADRRYIERNSIALLSRYRGGVDAPSSRWLGQLAEHPLVRASGLWNVDYVDLTYEPGFLEVLAQLAAASPWPQAR